MLSIIVAYDEERGIGINNDLPWYLPKDLNYFKNTTLNHAVAMGMRTYKSIGRPLPDRTNFVITTKEVESEEENVVVVNDLDAFFQEHMSTDEEIFVIGGKSIYEMALPFANKLYISHIPGIYEVDTYFPEVDFTLFKKIKTEIVFPEEIEFAVYERKGEMV